MWVLTALAWERHEATVLSPALSTAGEGGNVGLQVLCSVLWGPCWAVSFPGLDLEGLFQAT